MASSWLGLDPSNPFLAYPDAAKYLARDLGYTGSVMDQTAERARQAQADAWHPGMDSFSAQDAADRPANALDKGFSDFIASKGYTFAPSMQGREPATTVYDSTGKQVGQYRTGDADSRMMQAAQVIIPAVVGAGFGGGIAAAGGLSGASAGAATGATSGAVSSGANGSNVLKGALVGGLLGGAGGYAKDAFGAAGSAGGDVAAMGTNQVGALSQPMDMSGFIQPSQGQFAGMSLSELDAYRAALNAADGAAAGMSSQNRPATLEDIRAAERAGYQSPNTPSTVTPATDSPWSATDYLRDTAANVKGAVSPVTQPIAEWMKANPTLGRLLFSGGTSLLSAMGGSGSTGSASSGAGSLPGSNGPAKQWTSPIQQGLLSPVKQYTPQPITQLRPQGLLAQGQANDGAWRFFGG